MLQFQYDFYNSPAPAALTRVKPSVTPPSPLTPNPKKSRPSPAKYKPTQYITIVVTSSLAKGAIGHGLRARLEVAVMDGRILTYDAVVKLAFSEDQQSRLRYEYSIFEHLAPFKIQGIPIVLGLFEPVEGGPLIMLSKYCGVDLVYSRRVRGTLSVTVHPRERYRLFPIQLRRRPLNKYISEPPSLRY